MDDIYIRKCIGKIAFSAVSFGENQICFSNVGIHGSIVYCLKGLEEARIVGQSKTSVAQSVGRSLLNGLPLIKSRVIPLITIPASYCVM